jgi:type VI secretion system protein
MNQGLFESLTGHFLDGTPVESVPQNHRRILSIMDHLNRMFNTREGGTAHRGEYGLPDVSDIYRRMPDAVEELRAAVKRAVERFEPRLENVRVVRRESPNDADRLAFIVTGQLRGNGGTVRFQTVFSSIGSSSIAPWKKS